MKAFSLFLMGISEVAYVCEPVGWLTCTVLDTAELLTAIHHSIVNSEGWGVLQSSSILDIIAFK